jgi:predicted dehydrogenase
MEKRTLTVAVIGCGRFSQFFVPLFKAHPVVEKVYVCDQKKDREEEFSNRFGVDRCESFEYALNSKDINAVAIFTQRFKHGKMVIDALKAGKHVYSAVPCAVSVDEIIEIEKLVREKRLTYSMGETGFYRAPAIYCREEFKKGTFGKFVYAEAQYNHDIRNMENSFRSSGGEEWKRFAGVPPFFYPTHSTSMVLSTMPGVYAKKVVALGYSASPRTDIYGVDGQNNYNNPFA